MGLLVTAGRWWRFNSPVASTSALPPPPSRSASLQPPGGPPDFPPGLSSIAPLGAREASLLPGGDESPGWLVARPEPISSDVGVPVNAGEGGGLVPLLWLYWHGGEGRTVVWVLFGWSQSVMGN